MLQQAQLLLMAILVVSLANFIVGSFMGPADGDELSKGFLGYNCTCRKLFYLLFHLLFFAIDFSR